MGGFIRVFRRTTQKIPIFLHRIWQGPNNWIDGFYYYETWGRFRAVKKKKKKIINNLKKKKKIKFADCSHMFQPFVVTRIFEQGEVEGKAFGGAE